MREIRFRAWDKNQIGIYGTGMSYGKPEYFDDMLAFRFNHFESDNPEEIVYEQFTGLRDKNGREIYEGDIVRFDVVATERGPGPLGLTGIVQDVPRYGWGIGGYSPAWIKNEEVIGNIHENPELLNEAV